MSYNYPYLLTILIWPVLFLYLNVFVLNMYSYAYVAFLITTLFNILYSGLCLLRDINLVNFRLYSCKIKGKNTDYYNYK